MDTTLQCLLLSFYGIGGQNKAMIAVLTLSCSTIWALSNIENDLEIRSKI